MTDVKDKVKEYKNQKYQERIVKQKSYFDSVDIGIAFEDGYTLSQETLSKYREALRTTFNAVDTRFISKSDYEKAKQLLE